VNNALTSPLVPGGILSKRASTEVRAPVQKKSLCRYEMHRDIELNMDTDMERAKVPFPRNRNFPTQDIVFGIPVKGGERNSFAEASAWRDAAIRAELITQLCNLPRKAEA